MSNSKPRAQPDRENANGSAKTPEPITDTKTNKIVKRPRTPPGVAYAVGGSENTGVLVLVRFKYPGQWIRGISEPWLGDRTSKEFPASCGGIEE